jgi:uncharacterized DUF497 family protein
MRVFNWNRDKNEELKKERGISFETVVFLIEKGLILDDYIHPNQNKYPGQKIFEILVKEYVFLVPYVETDGDIFLKTIIPSRKARRKYIKGAGKNDKKV